MTNRSLLAATSLALSMFVAGVAHATPGPADDRLVQTPVSWTYQTGLSTSEVQAIVDEDEFRITDLRIEDTSPMTYSVVLVENTGAYKVTNSFFFHGITPDNAEDTFRDNNKRPIVMRAYVDDDVVKVAGITVPNTGANFRSWDIRRGTKDHVTDPANRPTGHRPMIIDTYYIVTWSGYIPTFTQKFLLVWVDNTEGYNWSWGFNKTASQIDALQQPYNSLIDASCNNDDLMKCSVILYPLPTTHGVAQGSATYDLSWLGLMLLAMSNQERLLFMTHYTLHGGGTYDGYEQYFGSTVDNW